MKDANVTLDKRAIYNLPDASKQEHVRESELIAKITGDIDKQATNTMIIPLLKNAAKKYHSEHEKWKKLLWMRRKKNEQGVMWISQKDNVVLQKTSETNPRLLPPCPWVLWYPLQMKVPSLHLPRAARPWQAPRACNRGCAADGDGGCGAKPLRNTHHVMHCTQSRCAA